MANISHKINQVQDKINSLYKQIQGLESQAKNNLKKSQESKGSVKEMYKQRCLMALKKKKQLQTQVKSYNSHQNTLQQVVFTAQTMNGHKQMYDALKGAVDVQKAAMKDIDIDKMDDLQDQMLELKMQSNLMNEMLNRNYDVDCDDDEFEDEFMEFQKEVAIEKKQAIAKPIKQPQQKLDDLDLDQYLK